MIRLLRPQVVVLAATVDEVVPAAVIRSSRQKVSQRR